MNRGRRCVFVNETNEENEFNVVLGSFYPEVFVWLRFEQMQWFHSSRESTCFDK